jgi:hypothetical protein
MDIDSFKRTKYLKEESGTVAQYKEVLCHKCKKSKDKVEHVIKCYADVVHLFRIGVWRSGRCILPKRSNPLEEGRLPCVCGCHGHGRATYGVRELLSFVYFKLYVCR